MVNRIKPRRIIHNRYQPYAPCSYLTHGGHQEHWCISFMHLYKVKPPIMYSRLNASRVNRVRLLYLLGQIHSSRLFNAKNYCWTIYFVKKIAPLARGRDGLVRPCRASQSRPASSRYTHNDRCNRNDDRSSLHPFCPVIVSVGKEESAKLNNRKLFEHDRRADGAFL